jgi:hypothetical protein
MNVDDWSKIQQTKRRQAMACKTKMVEELGEGELLLPNLVNEALSANDRAKYLMTLLQMAKDHADYPDLASPDLKQERLACGITESGFDSVIERSQREEAGVYRVPKAREIHHDIVENTRRMLVPLKQIFYSSSPVFDVSPFAMGRDSSSSRIHGATS